MNKYFKLIIIALFLIALVAVVVACHNTPNPTPDPNPSVDPTPDPSKKTFSGITFNNVTATYDGAEHAVTVSGILPEGAKTEYTNNKATNAGTYNATATVSGEGYNTLTLNATLTINKASYDMSGIGWNYTNAFDYDGQVKSVELSGTLPRGVTVKAYTDNSKTDAGTYQAKVTFNYDDVNYNTPEVSNCTWTINKIDITANLTMSNSSVEYDALPHSIQVVGNVPAGVVATYYYNDVQTDQVTEVGEYTVKCVLSGTNYNSQTLTATLKITGSEEQLYSAVTSNGKVYFQNNLDSNKLYAVNGSGVTKVSNDIPNYMISNDGKLYYFSTSLFSKVIKSFDGTTAKNMYSVGGEYLATDGTNMYYAVNNKLFNTDLNGIYKCDLDGSSDTATRLTSNKASYLTYVNGYVYYSNQSDGGKLYRISVNADNAAGTKLHDEKVAYIITDGTNLYFNSTKTTVASIGVAAAVYRYNIASGAAIKLTTDSGKYLTKVNDYVYYVNNDKITSNLFGDGIYRVNANATADSSFPGTKVLEADGNNGYSSLASDGNNLYYYKLNDKHFYKYNVSSKSEIDLMLNFQPIDDTVLLGYSQLAQFNGEVYYTNPLDNGCLYKYNVSTKATYKVLADSVSNVNFYRYNDVNYMYYSTYLLTNYALFRMNLGTGEITKVTSKRVDNLIFEGDKIYCVRVTAGTNSIIQMDLDGSNEAEIYSKTNASPDTTALYKIDNTFYFIMNPGVGHRNVDSFTIGNKDKTDLQRALSFVIVNNKIYYYAAVSSGLVASNVNELKVCDLNGKNEQTLVRNVDITFMYEANGKIYYSSKSTQNTGLFVYDVAQSKTTKISDKLAYGMTVCEGKLYFLQSQVTYTDNYPYQSSTCDGHLYCYDGTKVSRVV